MMESFLATYSLYEAGPPAVDVDATLPGDLREMLRQVGTNVYANGFFRFTSPNPLRDYLALAGLEASECVPFLKCAFGQILFHHRKEYKFLNPVYNTIDVAGGEEDLAFVMDIALCDRPAMEASFQLDVFEAAFPRLGVPTIDEIYAFVPALALGGGPTAESVRKTRMDVEMRILLQL